MTIVAAKLDMFSPAFSMRGPRDCTIAEIVAAVPGLPDGFREMGIVRIDGAEVYREVWHRVRPQESRNGAPVVVTLHMPTPEGGRGKQILTILATIVLAVATAGIASGALLPGVTAAFGATGASLVAAGVGIVGRMLITALTPPPVAPNIGGAQQSTPQAGISGNVLAPLRPLPGALGTIVYSPPMLVKPYSRLSGPDGDVTVHFICGMAGRYQVTDPQINGISATEFDTVTLQIREGALGDAALTINDTTCIEVSEQQELTNFQLKEPDDTELDGTPADADPKWHYVRSSGDADIFNIRLAFPAGLFRQDTEPENAIVPFRVQFRQVGTATWKAGPELHLTNNKLASFVWRAEIGFVWEASSSYSIALSPNDSNEPQAYWKAAAGQTYEYQAESYFNPGTGNYARHIQRTAQGYLIHLETATFPKGAYEFRIMRGSAFQKDEFTPSTYAYAGSIANSHFFTAKLVSSVYRAPITQQKYLDKCVIETTMTETLDYPFGFTGGIMLIAGQAKAMQVNTISATFSRYTPVWDGSSWANVEPTNNAAALYRHVLLGRDNPDAVDESLVKPGVLEAWYEDGFECNAVVQDYSVDQVLQLIASAGWAVPQNNEMRSVIREYDRSNDDIVQKFTPLNSSNLTISKDFDDKPHALRIEFFDEDDGYKLRDTYVYADGYDSTNAIRFEALTESGITNRTKVRDKGLFYLRQMYMRARHYSLDVGPEVLISERGDLVGVTNDVLSIHHYFGLVSEVLLSGSDVVGITLQAPVDMSFSALATPGVSIRQKDGSMLFKRLVPADGETDTLTFYTPFTDTLELGAGNLVSVGEIGQEYRRCLIHGIEFKPDLSASLALLDVADGMWPVVAPPEEDGPGIGTGTAWEFVGISNPTIVSSGSITLTEPAGVEEGDLLIACIAMRGSAAFTAPSGFPEVEQMNNATTVGTYPQASAMMASRVRGATAPSLTFARTGGDVALGRVLAYRGNKSTSPVDVSDQKLVTSFATRMPGLTTTEGDELIVSMLAQTASPVYGFQEPTMYISEDPEPDQWILRGHSSTTTGANVGLNIVSAVKRVAGSTGDLAQVVPTSININVLIAAAFKSTNS